MSIILGIGCGTRKKPGMVGIDCRKIHGVDVVADFENGLPFKDGCIAGANSIHSMQYMRDEIA